MPEIQAFRALRYDLGHIGSLADVVAPPYDVISPELRDELYKRHPCNIVRLILNRPEPGDDEANNTYLRAARFLKTWRTQGVLFAEADPAVYVYHQQFELEGCCYIRRGFVARMLLQRFGQGMVFAHEQTMRKPKIDRLMLTAVCKTNLSPVFGLYPDPDLYAQRLLDDAVGQSTPIEVTDHLGTVHRMWPVTDVAVISALSAAVGPKPVFIADGHHRYETACDYRDQLAEGGFLRPDHPANYVLTMLVAMQDPGLTVLPTHRLFPGLPALTSEELVRRLESCFACQFAGSGPEAARNVWEDIATSGSQDVIGFFTSKDSRWTIARLTAEGRQRMDQVAPDHQDPWRQLGVSVLHRLVLATLLEWDETPQADYVHDVDQVAARLKTGQYPLAALVMPATVKDIQQVSMCGERLPPKSTYFFPKLLSGLVLNPLE